MTAIINLFWSLATSHGPDGVVLAWLALAGVAQIGSILMAWLANLTAAGARGIRKALDAPFTGGRRTGSREGISRDLVLGIASRATAHDDRGDDELVLRNAGQLVVWLDQASTEEELAMRFRALQWADRNTRVTTGAWLDGTRIPHLISQAERYGAFLAAEPQPEPQTPDGAVR